MPLFELRTVQIQHGSDSTRSIPFLANYCNRDRRVFKGSETGYGRSQWDDFGNFHLKFEAILGKINLITVFIEIVNNQDHEEQLMKARPIRIIPPHGGYRRLKSYQMTEIIYDATIAFCNRFIDRRSRTHDQMVQAARSGKQNIAEGSMASGTSKKFEIKLMGVARASLEELLLDYEDFIRQKGLLLWGKNHDKARAIRSWTYKSNRTYLTYKTFIEEDPPETCSQHHHLSDPPGQLSTGSSDHQTGSTVS